MWSIEQSKQFLELNKLSRFYTAYVLAIYTGMRKSEILGLKWSDIDMDKRIIRINRPLYYADHQFFLNEPKTSSSKRSIMVPSDVIKVL